MPQELDLENPPMMQPQSAARVEYLTNAGASMRGLDDYSSVPIQVERRPVVPVSIGLAAGMPFDSGTLRNRVDLEHTPYELRVYALTLLQSGPGYSSIVQHVMQENAEQFSIHTGQTPPYVVDTASQLPYVTAGNTRETVLTPEQSYMELA